MMQSALQKERREIKNARREEQTEKVETRGSFMDPVASGGWSYHALQPSYTNLPDHKRNDASTVTSYSLLYDQ